MNWEDTIQADIAGMAGGDAYYSIEDLYQAFKERLLEEIKDDPIRASVNGVALEDRI